MWFWDAVGSPWWNRSFVAFNGVFAGANAAHGSWGYTALHFGGVVVHMLSMHLWDMRGRP
jgi:hypothetical protein